jgi:hypothetical protein
VRADQHQALDALAAGHQAGDEAADAVADHGGLRRREALRQPVQHSGTILASPVLDTHLEPLERGRRRGGDAAVIVGERGQAPIGEPRGEAAVVARRDAGPGVDDDVARRRRAALGEPERRRERVAVGSVDDERFGEGQEGGGRRVGSSRRRPIVECQIETG